MLINSFSHFKSCLFSAEGWVSSLGRQTLSLQHLLCSEFRPRKGAKPVAYSKTVLGVQAVCSSFWKAHGEIENCWQRYEERKERCSTDLSSDSRFTESEQGYAGALMPTKSTLWETPFCFSQKMCSVFVDWRAQLREHQGHLEIWGSDPWKAESRSAVRNTWQGRQLPCGLSTEPLRPITPECCS